jgi:peptide/nickel transport system ATP-binding protein
MTRILDIRDLFVDFNTPDGVVHAVRGVSAHINAGECLGIVGESGSGKSQTVLAAMGLLSANGFARGTVEFKSHNLIGLPAKQLNAIRGHHISMIFQDPLTSLTPHMRIGQQMREVLRAHNNMSGSAADAHCLEWLERVHIAAAKSRLRQYPHQLSGGMRQRVMIAMAMLCGPELLIADEPSTALDVTIQAEILDLMDDLRRERGTAIALITHDMGVVARMCDRIHVMRNGVFVEDGTAADIFYRPRHDYTRMLLKAVPRINVEAGSAHQVEPYAIGERDPDFLKVRDMRVEFNISRGLFRRPDILRAVDGVSFDLMPGETLGVVGESGSGKSTLARAVLQLIAPSAGTVSWLGTALNELDSRALKQTRQDLQIVFQDPMASLDPSMTIGDSIMEPLKVFARDLSKSARNNRVAEILERVGLDHRLINRYPHELSGGQNQRVGIARATILKPRLIICDEAVSALDVSIQAQIMALLMDLQSEFDLSFIFISHDLSVVWQVSHRILVLYLGAVVELTDRDRLFRSPQHPYTKQLISAAPIPDPNVERRRKRLKLKGELYSPIDPRARLRFLPSKIDAAEPGYVPRLEERFPGHFVAEHDPIEDLLVSS